ncbi:MAG: kelch repeat-containing protein [Burkholderiaceae bacterium]|nr:kelch repeat-containing protein [Burkholderiaceae bacterium]
MLTGAMACALLASCGGKSNSTASTTPPTVGTFSCPIVAYTSGFTSGFEVQCKSSGAISADGATIATYTWSFGDQVTSTNTPTTTGAPIYHVYVQPGNYTVTLTVTDDHGTTGSKSLLVPISFDAAKAANVTVSGVTAEGVENWAWIGGSKFANSTGDFNTQFTASALNQPSARQSAASWTSLDGKLWMLGGAGYDSAGTSGQLNDLWMFDPTAGQWTWVAGSNKANQYGTFGTQGKTASTNVISARSGAATWVDQSGNFWLFGGEGFDKNNNYSYLNDMWMLNPQNGEATWVVTGSSGVGNSANLCAGTPATTIQTSCTASTSSSPSGRAYATTWVDSNHVFWLFGGQTVDSSSGSAYTLDDLWSYDPNAYDATAHPNGGKGWIWVSGTPNSNTKGVYPSVADINSGAATNHPGGRLSAQGWTDKSGNLWLFGGSGFDSAGSGGSLNDLWMYKYDIKTGTGIWTWVGGSNTVANATGVYTAASGNVPGGRLGTSGWVDASGNFWMFGGSGSDSTATTTSNDGGGALNELWMLNIAYASSTKPPTTPHWTWVGGVNTAGIAGVYITETPSTTGSNYNTPGSRLWGTGWLDSSGNFWLFGGAGMDSQGTSGYLNDLWKVQLTVQPSGN